MTPTPICFRPEFSQDYYALTAILGEQGIDPSRVESLNPSAGSKARPEAATERLGEACFRVTITDPDELVDLIEAINTIPDSHRMLQTLDTEDHFDGDWIEGCEARAGRILAILDRAHEPERAKAIYRQIVPVEDPETDRMLKDIESRFDDFSG